MPSSTRDANKSSVKLELGKAHRNTTKRALFYICAFILARASKSDFLQSRPAKGLIYYHNATGNANYDQGGDSFDVMRVLLDDYSHEFDERYPISEPGQALSLNTYSVGGDILETEDYSSTSHFDKRLGLRGCCSGYSRRSEDEEVPTRAVSPEYRDYNRQFHEFGPFLGFEERADRRILAT
ncbi:hypothetical protein E3Q22_03980 [Wallemia mellicola]|uniref:Uncharacterized protein n=1 Tax=Wallemia mellicola TaxID=1708541 RepID=A0A4T0LZ19_9BASI|nr:hypothetical protein E3Q22_03980 [Wallemia mellicola]